MTVVLKAKEAADPRVLGPVVRKALLRRLVESAVIPKQALERAPRPYTFSTLMSTEDREAREAARDAPAEPTEDVKRECFRIRLCWLEDAHRQAFLNWAPSQKSGLLYADMESEPVLMEGALVSSTPTERWSGDIAYKQLQEDASDSLHSVTLKFCSPTLLNRAGVPYPLPDPASIFEGYLRLWNEFSLISLDPGLRTAIEEELLLSDFRIRARPHEGERGPLTCFTGSATFHLGGRQPESILRGFNVLADFAFFCGTGTQTNSGMGLTRRILDYPHEA